MGAFTIPLKQAIKFLGAEAKVVNGLMTIDGDIGLSHYPIFDEAYRPLLNGKIVRHYWNQEIGVETADLFKFNLETDMAEVMPYFNQLYASEKLTFDPFSTIDIKTLLNGSATNVTNAETSSNTESETNSQSRAVQSTTPQTQLSRNKDYASAGADSSGKNTSTGAGTEAVDSTATDTTENESHTTGYQGLTSDMLIRYRESFINIDVSVIDSLSNNFMLITNSGSRYSDFYTYGRYGF